MRSSRPMHHAHRRLNSIQSQLFYTKISNLDNSVEIVHKYDPKRDLPNVLLVHDFINEHDYEEIVTFMNTHRDAWSQSCHDGCSIDHTQRYSYDMMWPNFCKHKSLKKLCDLLHINTTNIEHPQLICYTKGGHFCLHHDTAHMIDVDGNAQECSPYSTDYIDMIHDISTYRTISGLLYLNTLDDGHTYFPKLNFKQKPIKSALLLWPNVKPDGSIEQSTVHTGCSVGTLKQIMNVWINTC